MPEAEFGMALPSLQDAFAEPRREESCRLVMMKSDVRSCLKSLLLLLEMQKKQSALNNQCGILSSSGCRSNMPDLNPNRSEHGSGLKINRRDCFCN